MKYDILLKILQTVREKYDFFEIDKISGFADTAFFTLLNQNGDELNVEIKYIPKGEE